MEANPLEEPGPQDEAPRKRGFAVAQIPAFGSAARHVSAQSVEASSHSRGDAAQHVCSWPARFRRLVGGVGRTALPEGWPLGRPSGSPVMPQFVFILLF